MNGAPPEWLTEYENGTWETDTRAILETYLTAGSIFLDIGAWIGPVTRWALNLGATVHAYEPDPAAYPHLAANCPEAHCHNVAVTLHDGITQLARQGEWGNSMTRIGPGRYTTRTVAVQQLPDATLIKLDVEGYETIILPELLATVYCPIWVSWHEPWWPTPFHWDQIPPRWAYTGSHGQFGNMLFTP